MAGIASALLVAVVVAPPEMARASAPETASEPGPAPAAGAPYLVPWGTSAPSPRPRLSPPRATGDGMLLVAGAVTFARTDPESVPATVAGSALMSGAYASGAAGIGLVLYDAGRRVGAAEVKLSAGTGGMTLWF